MNRKQQVCRFKPNYTNNHVKCKYKIPWLKEIARR